MAPIEALRAAWESPGLEHLWRRVDGDGARADSVIIALDDVGRPFRARFAIETDAGWRVRRAAARRLPRYRRLPVALHQHPAEPAAARERRTDGARWRFRRLDTDFTAELPVDGVGVVRDYPGIARRLR